MPPKVNQLRSLDIAERQVLANYEEDLARPWHMRVLLCRLEKSTWIVLTPTGDVYAEDLADADDFRMIGRDVPIPNDCRPVFAFDPVSEDDMDRYRHEARELATVLGYQPESVATSTSDSQWILSDTAVEGFGTEVAPEVVGSSDRIIIKGAVALVRITDPETDSLYWTTAQRVRTKDLQDWLDEKRSGVGRDQRLSSISRSSGSGTVTGCVLVTLKDAAAALPPRKTATSSTSGTSARQTSGNGIFQGPSALTEVLQTILASGLEPAAYRQHWRTTSGITPNSGLAIEFGLLVEILWLSTCHDLLNPFELSSLELVARRLLMIERAVKRNSRNPDFEGLDPYLGHTLDPSGGTQSSPFAEHIAQIQKTEAIVMKQNRLLAEEVTSSNKKKGDKAKVKAKGKEGEG